MPREQDIEKLEQLPLRERNHDYSWENDDYFGRTFPYSHMRRWINSCKGKHIDKVISEFIHADWVPKYYRYLKQLRRHIEIDTFIHTDGKIYYYNDYCRMWNDKEPYTLVENRVSDCVYVHPTTRLLCVYKAPTRKSWLKREQEKLVKRVRILGDYHQLYKIDGIWYEIKAKPLPDLVVSFTHKRKGPKDILLEGSTDWRSNAHRPYVEITLKRQLNSKELKKHSLTNSKK